jgi:hypothetical protein
LLILPAARRLPIWEAAFGEADSLIFPQGSCREGEGKYQKSNTKYQVPVGVECAERKTIFMEKYSTNAFEL